MEKQFICISTSSDTAPSQRLAMMLKEKYDFKFTDDYLLNSAAKATEENISKVLTHLCTIQYSIDVLLIYWSTQSNENKNGWLVPQSEKNTQKVDFQQQKLYNFLLDVNAKQILLVSETKMDTSLLPKKLYALYAEIEENQNRSFLNIFRNCLEQNKKADYSLEKLAKDIQLKSNVQKTVYAPKERQIPSFLFELKASEEMLWDFIEAAEQKGTMDEKLALYDRYIAFCRDFPPNSRFQLDLILERKGILQGILSQAATIEEKKEYLAAAHAEIDKLRADTAEVEQRLVVAQQQKEADERRLKRQRAFLMVFGMLFFLVLIAGVVNHFVKPPPPSLGISAIEGAKLIREKITAFNETLQAMRLKDDAFEHHQKSLLRYFTAPNNQACHVKAGNVLDTLSVQDYLQKELNITEDWVIEKIEKQEEDASETMTTFKIRIQETKAQGRKIIGAACSKDSFDNYTVRFTELRLVQK